MSICYNYINSTLVISEYHPPRPRRSESFPAGQTAGEDGQRRWRLLVTIHGGG